MGRVNYRIVTLVAALVSSALSAASLAFLVTALVSYRAEDFLTASKTDDMTTLGVGGTCTETLTDEQVRADADDEDVEWPSSLFAPARCAEDPEKGNRASVRNSLSVSVHGVFWAYYGTPAKKGLSTDLGGLQFTQVMGAMMTHVVGGEGNVPTGINYTTARYVLREVSKVDVPVSCDTIYGRVFATDINDDQSHWDRPLEAYITSIREGRMDDDERIKETWPLSDLVVDCDDGAISPGAGAQQDPTLERAALPPATIELLHAHCHAQFQFASVGTVSGAGTHGIPLPGIQPGPSTEPYPHPDGFNSTSSYNMRARMYLGQRFGYSVWAYVPMFLATCFLLSDSVVFFLAEAVMPLTLAESRLFSTSSLSQARDSLVIAATTRSSRKKRLTIGFFAVMSSFLFYGIFIAAPWGFWNSRMPRPICEKTAAMTGAKPHHDVPLTGWMGTKGGWRSDIDATWYDIAALTTQLFVLLLLPLTTSEVCRSWNAALEGATDGRATKAAISQEAQIVSNTAKYRQHQRVFMVVMTFAIVVILAGQSISGARFGMAWAEGVVGQEVDKESNPIFDEVQLSEAVYDQTVATIALTVACGLVFAAALQRHLINGVGCYSASLFCGWTFLVIVFALPLTFYAANRSIFSEKASTKDCALFPRDSHEFENDLCISRFWSLLVGGSLFVGTLLLITALGLREALQSLMLVRKNAAVYIRAPDQKASLFSGGDGVDEQSGYRSESESFFNYKIQAPKRLHPLQAPHMKVAMPRI